MCLIQICMGMLPRSEENRWRLIATYVLFLANIVFLITGLTFIGLGLIFLLLQKTILALLPFSINLFAVPLLTIGALVYVITALGFFSAWKQWRSLLVLYALCMAVLVVSQGCVEVATWGMMDRVETMTHQWVVDAFFNEKLRETFHLLEISLKCCGTYGALSYAELDMVIPPSCCEAPEMIIRPESILCHPGISYGGCAPIVSTHLSILAGVADSTLFYAIAVEAVALIASLYLLRSPKLPSDEYCLVANNNLQDNHTHIEMDQLQLATSQPERQISFDVCDK